MSKETTVPEVFEDKLSMDIDIIPGPDPSVATFVFYNESHTLGNSLRYILMKNKDVSFCGYTVPHPLETKMQLRLQCNNGKNAVEVLNNGLKELMNICDVVEEQFMKATKAYDIAVGSEMVDEE